MEEVVEVAVVGEEAAGDQEGEVAAHPAPAALELDLLHDHHTTRPQMGKHILPQHQRATERKMESTNTAVTRTPLKHTTNTSKMVKHTRPSTYITRLLIISTLQATTQLFS